MHQTINLYQFRAAFGDMGRGDNFSYEGLEVLFDYLEEYEDSTGCPVELDVITLCCDFREESWATVAEDYSINLDDCEDDEERINVVREYLQDNTMLCGEWEHDEDGTMFVYQCF